MAFSDDTMLKCSEHLSAYKSACEEHPDLKSFDYELQKRTNKVIDSLTVEDTTGKSSQHAVHIEVSKHLLEVTQSVANFLTQSKTDVWRESEGLRSLVMAYFDNTIKTLEIFNTIANCVEKAEMGQLLIQEAVAEFEKELKEKDVVEKKKKYEMTLKKLKKFKEMGDPFAGHVFTTQFDLIKMQQETLLNDVSEAKKKLHEEITDMEKGSVIMNVVFGAVVAIVAVASIALIATGVGVAVGIAGFASLAAPLIAVGWAGVYTNLDKKKDALNKDLEELKKLEDIEERVEKGILTNEKASDTVYTLVKGLEDRIVFVLNVVDDAIEIENNEKAMGHVVSLLKEKVDKLTKGIKEVGKSVDEHSTLISEARLRVQKKILYG